MDEATMDLEFGFQLSRVWAEILDILEGPPTL